MNTETKTTAISEITLERATENGVTWIRVKENGTIVKAFCADDEEAARRFFVAYTHQLSGAEILASKFIDTEKRESYGRTVLQYRGITVTDRPHGDTPFTLIQDGQIIQHDDDRSITDVINTIDEILGTDIEEDETTPHWRLNQIRLENWDRRVRKYAEDRGVGPTDSGPHRDAWEKEYAANYPKRPLLYGEGAPKR